MSIARSAKILVRWMAQLKNLEWTLRNYSRNGATVCGAHHRSGFSLSRLIATASKRSAICKQFWEYLFHTLCL